MNGPTKLVAVAAAWAIWAAVPAAADPADPGAVQTLVPSRPSTPALDEQFLADLTRAGMRIADAPTAIAGAHNLCAYLAAGHVTPDAVEQGQKNNPTMTRADEITYIGAAVRAYCPRYVGQTEPTPWERWLRPADLVAAAAARHTRYPGRSA